MVIQKIARGLILLLLPFAALACPPEGYTNERLLQLRETGFEIEDADQRNGLAVALLGCVAEPNPKIRDGVVFEGISTWLRAGDISAETLQSLYTGLIEQISNTDDPEGFRQPFAALILSEVARTDRIEPWMTESQRKTLVLVTAKYLAGVSDYRGFSESEGWRHGVAHGSDIVLQLVLNEKVTTGQIHMLLGSVLIQIAPEGGIFYIYGEPTRLARAVSYAYLQGKVAEAEWLAWFEKVSNPAPLTNWAESYSSQAGLAKRHNTLAFLQAMHFNATAANSEQASSLAKIVLDTIVRVLSG
jgi:hypothetical protein